MEPVPHAKEGVRSGGGQNRTPGGLGSVPQHLAAHVTPPADQQTTNQAQWYGTTANNPGRKPSSHNRV